MRNASPVDLLGLPVTALELPALYASKRTDRPRDALHRQAIEDRLRRLVLDGAIEIDEVILACCLDREVAAREDVTGRLRDLAGRTRQPLLQTRLLALGLGTAELLANPDLHPTVRSLAALDTGTRSKLVDHPARFAALLARIPLVLPDSGHHVREKGV
jgi:hypothetical protein